MGTVWLQNFGTRAWHVKSELIFHMQFMSGWFYDTRHHANTVFTVQQCIAVWFKISSSSNWSLFMLILCVLVIVIHSHFVAVLLQCMLGISHVLCWTWLESLTASKTTLMCLKPLRGFRKLFIDHITKRSRKGVKDKMGCEHNRSVIDHFHSNLSHLSSLSGQRARYSAGNTVYIAHTALTCHNPFCEGNCRGWHQSQKYTTKIKMSDAGSIKITGPITPVMKRNKGDSKVNTIFSLFPEKKIPLTGFALLLLIDWGALLKRPPAVLLLEDIFFSCNNDLMSSKCPSSEALM